MKSEGKNPKVVAVSGGFDPVHIGHIRMFREARALGDRLVVIMNNDNWLLKKKGYVFMPQQERKEVIEAIRYVDDVVVTGHGVNPDDMSVCRELELLRPDIFANGGDRFEDNIPEAVACGGMDCALLFNVGAGGKIQSSSWLVGKPGKKMERNMNIGVSANTNINKDRHLVSRPWGGYQILKKNHGLWIKKLFIKKGARLSLQSHELRTEVWVVISGQVEAQVGNVHHRAGPDDVIVIAPQRKHRLTGVTDACVMELAQGQVLEHDIVRYEDDYGRV